jgi:hypothetical protein
MARTSIDATDVAILGRVLQPDKPTLSPDAARSILALEFGQPDRERMHQLALKAQEGRLTAQEEVELENYRRVGNLLSMMKSKARKSLKYANEIRGA